MKRDFLLITVFSLITAICSFVSCNNEINIEVPHEHSYSDTWSTNEEYHWHAAICEHSDMVSGKSEHVWNEGEVTTAPTEDADGVKTYECTICKRTKTEVIAKLSHVHNYETTWSYDATEHWHICSGCKEKGTPENHSWDTGTVTKEPTTKEEGIKVYKCTICEATKEEIIEKLAVTPDPKDDTEDPVIINKYPNDKNPIINSSASASLDEIFSTDSVGLTTINIRRSEWNQMLKNFDYFYKNENSVIAESYEYEKDGNEWKLNTVGLRLRGNTSRFRPQGKDTPDDQTGHRQQNYDWSQGYYNYAATCSDDDYRQSHFKVDFEPMDDDDRKMSSCMKGVALKRMDGSCTKEIFCYDLFHRYGIWTAPRASHTRVIINFIEDIQADGSRKEDITDCKKTKIDFGVYEMFEEVNKQSLKARDKDENKASNAWKNAKGNLWKCAGGDLADPNAKMDLENVCITDFDSNGNPTAFVWDSPVYDLKTNKKELSSAAAELKQFITELNALPNVANESDVSNINKIKNFYEKWMDVDFFLKTYAVNILVGMDDDYWSNKNNYYLYFTDTPSNGRQVYFIPFDYDNTLGSSIKGNKDNGEKEGIEQNPLEWGRGENRPLMDKLLQVPEYKELFKQKLIEVSSADAEWNYEKCSQRWFKYWDMVDPYLNSPDLSDQICTKGHWDNVYKPSGYSLINQSNNLYDYTRSCILSYLLKITVDLNGGSLNGKSGTLELTDFSPNLIPEKTGYMFLGWTTTKDGNDYAEKFVEGVKYYARWHDVSSYTEPTIFEVKNDSVKGICIGIYRRPVDGTIRSFYINSDASDENQSVGTPVSEIDKYDESTVNKNIWVYPYVTAGKKYKVTLIWKNSGWGWTDSTPSISVVAASGVGENWVEFDNAYDRNEDAPYKVSVDKKLTWNHAPKVYIAGQEISNSNMPGELKVALRGGGDNCWDWYGDIVVGYPFAGMDLLPVWTKYFSDNSGWNKNSVETINDKGVPLYLNITYIIKDSRYGEYKLEVMNDDYREKRYFKFN